MDYRKDSPQILLDFLSYHETIKAHSQRTVDEYYLDLRNFFRYMKRARNAELHELPLEKMEEYWQEAKHEETFNSMCPH